ncbi:hypothetical protein FRB95_002677 [Tulasnella sp. JGI-2019a]|nr:hypothetical protein FRB95_002677 [Tulasnella sp. JGI-2019a]
MADLLPEESLVNGKCEVDQSTLPAPAKAFHDMLVARMKVKKFVTQTTTTQQDVSLMESPGTRAPVFATPLLDALDRKAFNLISILKDDLGDEFTIHFEEVEGYTMNSRHLRILGSYVNVLVRHQGRELGFASDYSAMANEASFTAILADPAIDNIPLGYARGRKTLTNVVDYRGTLVKWEPREDFCVAYDSGTARYALLNGVTESVGESEANAMHKTSVVSKYSHQIIRQLTDKDTVILSVYFSERICKMYLFYKSSGMNEQYVMREILQMNYIFSHPSHAVGFLRRLHNFAAHVHPLHEGLSPAQALRRGMMERLGDDLPSAKTETRSKGQKKTETSSTSRENQPPSGAHDCLALAYETVSCDFENHCIKGIKPKSGDTEADLIAKWTTDTNEVDLIVSLQSVKHPQYRNGVIRVIDVLRYETLGAWVVMPRYTPLVSMSGATPLVSLSEMTPTEYHSFRLQVFEAVAFLHAERVAHRDIKPANIVVDLKQGSSMARVYIIDFGNARRCDSEYRCQGFQGTRGWTAPEVQDGENWEPMSADVWATAKILSLYAELADAPDQVMLDVVACREPSLRPTATGLFDTLHPRPAKHYQVSAELPRAKFQAVEGNVKAHNSKTRVFIHTREVEEGSF